MKKKILLTFLTAIFLCSCNIKFGTTDKHLLGMGSSKSPLSSVKYSRYGNDSLRVKTTKERFTVALPKNEVRFSVVCQTSEDIILRSFDKAKILVFVIKTKTWSEIKEIPKVCP